MGGWSGGNFGGLNKCKAGDQNSIQASKRKVDMGVQHLK